MQNGLIEFAHWREEGCVGKSIHRAGQPDRTELKLMKMKVLTKVKCSTSFNVIHL